MTPTDFNAEECPRFRVLVTGRGEPGKLSLIDAVFKTSLEDISCDQAGVLDKIQEIVQSDNECLDIRDLDLEKSRILKKALEEWNQKKVVAERLHAIWFCVPTPSSGDPIITFDKKIFKFNRKVPIIVVFTKLDVFENRLGEQGTQNGKSSQKLAETEIRTRYGKLLDALTKNVAGQKRYTFVATSQPETLQKLVDITVKGIGIGILDSSSRFERVLSSLFNGTSKSNQQARLGEDMSHSAQIALAAAQRVDKQIKVTASIKVGENIWNVIAPGEHCSDVDLEKRLCTIHEHVVTIWNIRGLNGFLLSEAFCRQMKSITKDHEPPSNSSTTVGDTGQQDVHQGRQELILKYFVNLVLILQAVFQISVDQKVTPDMVDKIVCVFFGSEREGSIHNAIITLVGDQHGNQNLPTSNSMADEIRLLIDRNEIKNDDPISHTKPPLPSLLAILRIALFPRNAINRMTLGFMSKLLDSQDYLNVISKLVTAANVQIFFDFTRYLRDDCGLENLNYGIPDANHKATEILKSLFKKYPLPKVYDVETNLSAIDAGGFGSVLKGQHEGRPVTLQVIYRADVSTKSSLSKDFCQKALAWWSLSHKSIHRLLGIYEEKSWLFLVSPYMESETLIDWRRNYQLDEVDIRRLMLEVAQGLQYIHSEGLVHGSLSAVNVLVDSEFHCYITDFGLTREIKSTLSSSAMTDSINYAAPELVGMFKRETTQTDVYAYGRLYYVVFFDAMPFEGKKPSQILELISSGIQPCRPDSPRMDDDTWKLVEDCWSPDPSKRPTMEQIVASHMLMPRPMPRPMSRPESLITSLMAELKGLSRANKPTINRMRKLLALSDLDSDNIISQLVPSDVELLLNFILRLLRNHCLAAPGSQDENRKARNLMFKLISKTSHIPKPLFVTDVETEERFGKIGIGSLGRNFVGKYKGKDVVLKVVNKGCKQGQLRQDFCREALGWRSIDHPSILPLEGLFKHDSELYLVSRFATNGTLCDWRRNQIPAVVDILKRLLEVAEGVQYIHSEGIVHGNLHTRNILLDDDSHCRIADFGTSRRSEASETQPAIMFALRFGAPELFGMCTTCGFYGCDYHKERNNHKTMETDDKTKTDVYAFGCLYYAIFFNTIPFYDIDDFQNVLPITGGKRPARLQRPEMNDMTWKLLQSCWKSIPSERPTMAEIVETLRPKL